MPPTIQGLDSFGQITEAAAAAAAEAGILVWGRYLYNLHPQEIEIGHAHGIGVLLIGEHDTTTHHPIHDGYSAGYAHGQQDRLAAIALGAPQGVGIGLMATADDKVFDGADEIALGAYMDGYRDGIAGPFEHCLYGGAGPVLWARQNGHVTAATWVAGASYWNNGIDPAAAQAQMHQLAAPAVNYGGTACDLNELYDLPALCAWMPDGTPPAPHPTPHPTPQHQEDLMGRFFHLSDDSIVYVGICAQQGTGSTSDHYEGGLHVFGLESPLDVDLVRPPDVPVVDANPDQEARIRQLPVTFQAP